MKVSVVYALPERQTWLEVEVPDQATVREAVELSGIARTHPTLDLTSHKVGIFGKIVAPDSRLEPGQRIEIYRPITADPQALRGASGESE